MSHSQEVPIHDMFLGFFFGGILRSRPRKNSLFEPFFRRLFERWRRAAPRARAAEWAMSAQKAPPKAHRRWKPEEEVCRRIATFSSFSFTLFIAMARGAGLSASARRARQQSQSGEAASAAAAFTDSDSDESLDSIHLSQELEDGHPALTSPKPARSVGRPRLNDGIAVPTPEEYMEMSPDTRKKRKREVSKKKSAAASARYRAKRAADQEEKDEEVGDVIQLRRLHDIKSQPGGWRANVAPGKVFETKALAIHAIREVAEVLGITLSFPYNDRGLVTAAPSRTSGVPAEGFYVEIAYSGKSCNWVVKQVQLDGHRGSPPGKTEARCAYPVSVISSCLENLISRNPGASSAVLESFMQELVHWPSRITANTWSRARREATVSQFGVPDNNVQMMPGLRSRLRASGHVFEYETLKAKDMKAVLISCARDDHRRVRARVLRKLEHLGQQELSDEEKQSMVEWSQGGKEAWLAANSDLVSSVADPRKNYLRGAYLALSPALEAGEELLSLYQLDACVGKVMLDCYTLFIIIGFTSNANIVPLVYSWQAANEAEASWSRALQFLRDNFEYFGESQTVSSDRDKGIDAALSSVFEESRPYQFMCVMHRKKNLAPFGKATVAMHEKLAYAATISEIALIRSSPEFARLTENAKSALCNVDDAKQFLSAAAAAGATTYGRSTSQAVESQNHHIADARVLDPFSSVISIVLLEQKRFKKWQGKCWEHQDTITPFARRKLNDTPVLQGRTVSLSESNSTDTSKTYFLSPRRASRPPLRVVLQFPAAVHAGNDTHSYFGTCSCGIPQRDTFPCRHMRTIADHLNLPSSAVVPALYWTSRWREQYPQAMHFTAPTRAEIEDMGEDGRDNSLSLPVAAPTKRGRPPVNRKRHAVEATVAQRKRRNQGRSNNRSSAGAS